MHFMVSYTVIHDTWNDGKLDIVGTMIQHCQCCMNIENYKNGFGEQQGLLNKKLAFYQGLNQEGAKKEVIKAVVGKDDKIEFWKFYDYMKDKTDDLDNLEY